jgi:hypothetical protein
MHGQRLPQSDRLYRRAVAPHPRHADTSVPVTQSLPLRQPTYPAPSNVRVIASRPPVCMYQGDSQRSLIVEDGLPGLGSGYPGGEGDKGITWFG